MDGVLVDLNSVILDLGGWVLTEAYAIKAFRLTPLSGGVAASVVSTPEPGSLWLAAIGAVALLIRIRLWRTLQRAVTRTNRTI